MPLSLNADLRGARAPSAASVRGRRAAAFSSPLGMVLPPALFRSLSKGGARALTAYARYLALRLALRVT